MKEEAVSHGGSGLSRGPGLPARPAGTRGLGQLGLDVLPSDPDSQGGHGGRHSVRSARALPRARPQTHQGPCRQRVPLCQTHGLLMDGAAPVCDPRGQTSGPSTRRCLTARSPMPGRDQPFPSVYNEERPSPRGKEPPLLSGPLAVLFAEPSALPWLVHGLPVPCLCHQHLSRHLGTGGGTETRGAGR